jgi:hypothetical protein
VFNEICTDDLYKDCLVHSPVAFFSNLDITKIGPDSTKRRQLCKVRTLRFCHSPSVDEPTSVEVFDPEAVFAWQTCGSLRYPNDPPVSERQRWDRLTEDKPHILGTSGWLSDLKDKGDYIMPNLERVVMKGMADDAVTLEQDDFRKCMSDLLVGLPSVKYYCQSSIYGQLAISPWRYRPQHPQK